MQSHSQLRGKVGWITILHNVVSDLGSINNDISITSQRGREPKDNIHITETLDEEDVIWRGGLSN